MSETFDGNLLLMRRTSVLALIPASYLMIGLDIAIVITALPKIHQGLGFSATS